GCLLLFVFAGRGRGGVGGDLQVDDASFSRHINGDRIRSKQGIAESLVALAIEAMDCGEMGASFATFALRGARVIAAVRDPSVPLWPTPPLRRIWREIHSAFGNRLAL